MATLVLLAQGTVQAQEYFQQRVDHRIDVRLDDEAHILRGTAIFIYHNHAPQTLDTLWIHLWPNAYRDRQSALCKQKDSQNDFDLHFATDAQRGWIDSLDFRNGDEALDWGYHPKHGDIGWIRLGHPLATGDSVAISTPFRVKVPDARFSRFGHTGQAYYVSQWYPKPAVYDRDGWHAMPYMDQGEFYADFGKYDVRITLPENYVLAATGERVDSPAEVAFMDSLAALPLYNNTSDDFPPSSPTTKTVRFVQDSVIDLAWFADKRYIVRKGEVQLERSGRTVTTWTLFTPGNGKVWENSIDYVNTSVFLYSRWAGDYPYPSCTAVDGTLAAGGGMEYPMITIIGQARMPHVLDNVIAHEVGHNWFQGVLASNERDHPWLDEGVNSFFEQRYMNTVYPQGQDGNVMGVPLNLLTGGKGFNEHDKAELAYRFNARRNWDAPPATAAADFAELDYGVTVYMKTPIVLEQLFHALGEELFDYCTQVYFHEWAFKHPRPEDMQASFERTSGRDLSWCFGQLIGTADKVDLKAKRLKGNRLTYRSTAMDGFPFPITAWAGKDSLGTIWHRAETGTHTLELPWRNADRIRIDAERRTLDISRRNNEVRSYGLLRRSKIPKLRLMLGVEQEERSTVYWTPAIAYNTHDGFMLGAALRNTTFPSQRLEWAAVPMYGFQSGRLAGGAHIMWNHDRVRSNWLRNVHVGVSGFAASLYGVSEVDQWYRRLVPSIQFDPKLKPTGPEAYLRYRSVMLWESAKGTLVRPDQDLPVDLTTQSTYHEASANITSRNGFNPYSITLTSLNSEAFNRVSIEAEWSAIYDRQKHRITLRAFGGSFLHKDRSLMNPAMGWRMYWGSSDLLYDHLYIDRQYVGQNTSAQFNIDQGGFRTPTSIGTSDTWIAALNTTIDFPFTLPLSAFASYGASPITLVTQDGRTTDWRGNWELGLGIRLWRDMIEMWVPLAYSDDIRKEQELRHFNFGDRIRFVLALEKMDPTQVLRRLPH